MKHFVADINSRTHRYMEKKSRWLLFCHIIKKMQRSKRFFFVTGWLLGGYQQKTNFIKKRNTVKVLYCFNGVVTEWLLWWLPPVTKCIFNKKLSQL